VVYNPELYHMSFHKIWSCLWRMEALWSSNNQGYYSDFCTHFLVHKSEYPTDVAYNSKTAIYIYIMMMFFIPKIHDRRLIMVLKNGLHNGKIYIYIYYIFIKMKRSWYCGYIVPFAPGVCVMCHLNIYMSIWYSGGVCQCPTHYLRGC
jgi:hypothetical protein